MWGICGSHSDWELVLILQTLGAAKPLKTHKSNIEAFILSCEQFLGQSVADNLMQVLMVLCIPREGVWVERLDRQPSIKLDVGVLAKMLAHSRD